MRVKVDLEDKALAAYRSAKKERPKDRYVWDAAVTNFGVRVSDTNPPRNVTFYLVTRFPGDSNPAARKIGDYPEISLADARAKAREWKEDIKKGVDPRDKVEAAQRASEASKQAAEREAANTFQAGWTAYIEERKADPNGRNRTLDVVDGVIAKHILPKLGVRPLKAITRAETNDILRKIAKNTPTHARRIASYLHTFGEWAENDGRIDEAKSPFAKLKKIGTENARERTLSEPEIKAIWKASGQMGAFGQAVRLLLATGQRRSEVGDLPWREIDFDKALWTLPAERTKPGRAHLVPLSPAALSILADVKKLGAHVFTTRTTPKGETIPISGWSKSKAKLDTLAIETFREQTGDTEAVIAEWHLHDLRRTAATLMTRECKVSQLVVGRILNHSPQGVTAQHYDLHDYLAEKKHALDLWGARLATIVSNDKKSANVVAFERAQA